ncbi:hypothetical protein Pmani_004019 [Petrolisthes manimaculis]|uniref:Uncharacterized protein n=1 Tax=Petrolisthes manimaculis TaxID=1843537 RepID=A0AAE1QF59_9EUCA|nr:hypothetical protein Pmani_004019 [Petrolisthes manimaculis]
MIKDADIKHRIPAVKEKLTDQHRDQRLKFAQEYKLMGDQELLFGRGSCSLRRHLPAPPTLNYTFGGRMSNDTTRSIFTN